MNLSVSLDHVPVQRLRGQITSFDAQEDPQRFDFGQEGPRCEGQVHLQGNLEMVNNELLVRAVLDATETIVCSRCLDETREPFHKDVFFTVEVGRERYLDLLPYFREELMIETPMSSLCRPDCQGLCSGCGVNLNHEKCLCSKK